VTTLRLLSYNIRHGGVGRVEPLAAVIRGCAPDVVVLQEATRPDVVRALAGETGLPQHGSHRGQSLGFLSRIGIAKSVWRRPLLSRHAFLDLTLDGHDLHIVGVHLSAVHAAWTERRRLIELASLLRTVKARQHGFHVLAGDFNTLAPGEMLDVQRLPARLRPLVWLSGGSIRWKTIAAVLAAGYADVWRGLHPEGEGATFPTWGRHLRLDYVFAPMAAATRVVRCEVVTVPDTIRASDHHPLVAEIDLTPAGAPA
jgi:exodeoxyribonuclease-3